jgi:3-oxoacid CoA-transferase
MSGKIRAEAAEVVADIRDGATVLIGGFSSGGTPYTLIDALLAQGARSLTVITNGYYQAWPLVEAGRVRRLVASFPVPRDPAQGRLFLERYGRGELEVEVVPQGTFVERIRAGGAGIPAFYCPTTVGTELAEGKETRRFGSKECVLETALRGDFALIRAHRADPYGNLTYNLAARNFNPTIATAAAQTIVEVEEVVALGEIPPTEVVTPGIFVDHVIRAPRQVHWTAPGYRVHATITAAKDHARSRFGGKPRLTRELIGLRVSRELRRGMAVNLGTGIPTVIANLTPPDAGVRFQSENGLLGYGPFADEAARDVDLVSATSEPVTLLPGASIGSSCDAFEMLRGGHLDLSVLGALQVAENGDLANWRRGDREAVGNVGGAMDIVSGTKRVIVAMEHTTAGGEPKLVERCTLPLTGRGVVSSVATDLAWIDITPEGFLLREVAPGWTAEEVRALTGARLRVAPDLREMEL